MIEISNITKTYGRKLVIDNISFSLNKGDCIGILGSNGSGKSTLLSILAGITKADSGSFIINDENALNQHKIIRDLIGYVPQENPLIDDLTVRDNLSLWYCNSPLGIERELNGGILDMLGINDFISMKTRNLSGGMKKRLSIAIALANHPPILILDEPGAALDIECKDDIKQYLTQYLSSGGTIIIATHDELEISLCNHLYLMKNHHLSEIKSCSTHKDILNAMKSR